MYQVTFVIISMTLSLLFLGSNNANKQQHFVKPDYYLPFNSCKRDIAELSLRPKSLVIIDSPILVPVYTSVALTNNKRYNPKYGNGVYTIGIVAMSFFVVLHYIWLKSNKKELEFIKPIGFKSHKLVDYHPDHANLLKPSSPRTSITSKYAAKKNRVSLKAMDSAVEIQ